MTQIPLLLLLCTLVFVYHFGIGLYYALGLEPSVRLEFLYTGAFLCGVVWWLRADTKTSGIKQVYCLGLIVGYAWIVIIPYHLLKTRGLRGLIPLLALIGSLLAAYVCTAIVYMIFAPSVVMAVGVAPELRNSALPCRPVFPLTVLTLTNSA